MSQVSQKLPHFKTYFKTYSTHFSVIRGKWTNEREDSFQSVASSVKDRIQIRDLKTGADIVLTRAEVIAKFREDRYNDEHGFDVNDDMN